MSYSEATSLMEALEIKDKDTNFEIALEVINKYGSYKKALQATIGIDFKKKEALLIALLGTEENELTESYRDKAEELISNVESIRDKVYEDSARLNIQFSDLVRNIKIADITIDGKKISLEDIKILDMINPYRSHKNLIESINCYQDGNVKLKAFIDAIKHSGKGSNLITKQIKQLGAKR